MRITDEHKVLASYCRSLGLPARVAIIEAVAKTKDCIVDDVVEIDSLSRLTTAAHLVSLKKEGIIKGKVGLTKKCYCIDWDKLDTFKKLFDDMYATVKLHQENVTCRRENCD